MSLPNRETHARHLPKVEVPWPTSGWTLFRISIGVVVGLCCIWIVLRLANPPSGSDLLRWNMTKNDVLTIMGQPYRVDALSPKGSTDREIWRYAKDDLPELVFEGDHLVSLRNRYKGYYNHPVNRGAELSAAAR